jgi:hypothetical protein
MKSGDTRDTKLGRSRVREPGVSDRAQAGPVAHEEEGSRDQPGGIAQLSPGSADRGTLDVARRHARQRGAGPVRTGAPDPQVPLTADSVLCLVGVADGSRVRMDRLVQRMSGLPAGVAKLGGDQ